MITINETKRFTNVLHAIRIYDVIDLFANAYEQYIINSSVHLSLYCNKTYSA